jgi:hypothetical protein
MPLRHEQQPEFWSIVVVESAGSSSEPPSSEVTGTDESRKYPGWKVDEVNQTSCNPAPIHPEFIAISFIGGAARPQSPLVEEVAAWSYSRP